MDELADEYELIFDLPSRLADRLHRVDLDVALIPSIEVANKDYKILSDACIGCRGEVWSVKLMCSETSKCAVYLIWEGLIRKRFDV